MQLALTIRPVHQSDRGSEEAGEPGQAIGAANRDSNRGRGLPIQQSIHLLSVAVTRPLIFAGRSNVQRVVCLRRRLDETTTRPFERVTQHAYIYRSRQRRGFIGNRQKHLPNGCVPSLAWRHCHTSNRSCVSLSQPVNMPMPHTSSNAVRYKVSPGQVVYS